MLKKLKLTVLSRPSRTNTPKRCAFHYRGLECKSRKSRDNWSNRQVCPWSRQWSRAKANRVLPRKYTGHRKHPLPTTQEMTLHMDITRWSTPKSDWLYFWSQRWRSSIQSAKTRPGADFGSDHELLIAKFRLKLKNAMKTMRAFRSDLNPIPYNYTVEVTNRFKGLDLIECLKNYGWKFITLYKRWWPRPSQRKRNVKRQNGCVRRAYKWLRKEEKWKAKEKRNDTPIWMQSSKEEQGEIRKPSSVIGIKK